MREPFEPEAAASGRCLRSAVARCVLIRSLLPAKSLRKRISATHAMARTELERMLDQSLPARSRRNQLRNCRIFCGIPTAKMIEGEMKASR